MKEYIERQAVYEKVAEMEELARNRFVDTPWDSPARERYRAQLDERTRLKHMLADLPAADVRPVVHGRWELKHIGAGHYWECSACHTNPRIYVTENTHFCPNCGAQMDGGEEAT